MFHRKTKAIVPFPNALPNTNKIKPSNTPVALKGPNTITNTNTDVLNQIRNTQVLSNAEYLTIALLKDVSKVIKKVRKSPSVNVILHDGI